MIEEFEFEATHQYDPNIMSVSFAEKNGEFSMEIFASNAKEALNFQDSIEALKRIYEIDASKRQNFDALYDEKIGTVKLIGNIFNAFKLLKETELISANLAEVILANSKVSKFLEETKNFVFPENKVRIEKQPSNPNRVEAALQETYADALSKLQPDEIQQAMSELAHILASKGTKVEINVQESLRKSPSVF